MSDLISRQAAIDEIKKCRFVVDAIEKIRGCLWNICRYENKFDKKENK